MPCDTGNDLNSRSQEVDVRSFGSTKSDEFIMADSSGVSFFKLSRHVTSHHMGVVAPPRKLFLIGRRFP